MVIDTSNNAWHSQVHWLVGTPYLAIKSSNGDIKLMVIQSPLDLIQDILEKISHVQISTLSDHFKNEISKPSRRHLFCFHIICVYNKFVESTLRIKFKLRSTTSVFLFWDCKNVLVIFNKQFQEVLNTKVEFTFIFKSSDNSTSEWQHRWNLKLWFIQTGGDTEKLKYFWLCYVVLNSLFSREKPICIPS